jgi:hypothetical protein
MSQARKEGVASINDVIISIDVHFLIFINTPFVFFRFVKSFLDIIAKLPATS